MRLSLDGAVGDVLDDGIARHVAPGACVEVGSSTHVLATVSRGRLTYDPHARPVDAETIFDVASLTKVLTTAPLVMQAVERGTLGLDDLVADHVAEWGQRTDATTTIRDLLAHCSGLPAHRRYFDSLAGEAAYTSAICRESFDYAPRSQAVYSDLGFILLGVILGGRDAIDGGLVRLLTHQQVVDPLQYRPPAPLHHRIAPTSHDPWRGRLLCGEVEDENAAALGGCAGHAGLFGTASAVGACARHVLQVLSGRTGAFARDTLHEFITPHGAPSSSRALGWDTMRPTSSCGERMSPRAFGHTGFTGTSLWIDPARDVYVAFLSNRVYPDRADRGIQPWRRQLHDTVITQLP